MGVTGLSRASHGCVKGESWVCQGGVMGMSRRCHGHVMGVSRECQGSVKWVPLVPNFDYDFQISFDNSCTNNFSLNDYESEYNN